MKLEHLARYRQQSGSLNRFYTSLDMAIIKREEQVLNSLEKRGKLVRHANRYIAVCGCGIEGCFVHGSHPNRDATP
jgi:hypothetical protein